MEHNSEWMNQIKERCPVYFGYNAEEYMTREIFDWNREFMDKYHELSAWRSEDGKTRYTEEEIAKELGLCPEMAWEFKNCVRKQIASYRTKQLKAQLAAGKTVSEIAEDLDVTEGAVNRMIERLGL